MRTLVLSSTQVRYDLSGYHLSRMVSQAPQGSPHGLQGWESMVHKFYIGIDVSLKKFDVSLFCEDKKSPHAVFENTPEGFASFLQWCRKNAGVPKNLHVVMEATNVYWEDLALFCQQKGATVSVVNPRLIKGYAKATGLRSIAGPSNIHTISKIPGDRPCHIPRP